MSKEWIIVRLQRGTHRQLQAVRESMRVADVAGLIDLEKDNRDRVSLDEVIRKLIAFRERHAARRRRSAAKKASRAAPGNSLAEAPSEAPHETLANGPTR